jgi:predicted O-linked N-acetylglucosamine transferase (SPINDLY family)
MTMEKRPVSSLKRKAAGAQLNTNLNKIRDPEFCCQLGEQALKKGQPEVALGFFQQATGIDSKSTRGWFGQGMAFTNMEEYARSCQYFREAVKLDDRVAVAHHNLGRSLHEIGQADLAYESFQTSIGLGFAPTRKSVAVAIPGCPSASNSTVLNERRQWVDGLLKSIHPSHQEKHGEREKGKKVLKIAYMSAFFHKENWMKPVWGLLGQHDRENFQIHLVSDRTKLTRDIAKFIKPDDRFHDISDHSNDEASALIASLGIDILVDLNGYSYPDRFPVFLNRPAPLIVGWFNMYATTGFECFDYLVGDECVIPPDEEAYYSEKIARVKGSYLTFSVAYDVPELSPPPCLSKGSITFGSLISQYKITDHVIDAWCGILNETPGSQLLVRNACLGKESNKEFLHSQFVERGIDSERLTLEGPAPHFEFLKTYNRIDIALDAFPYNGGTTTTEAIWQGVPVVTYWGDRWVSRTSATLLRSAGLHGMVAEDVAGYVRLAGQLASDPEKLTTLRQNMRDKLLKSDACDTTSFARSMESLYRELWSN